MAKKQTNAVATIPNDVPEVLSLLQAELDKQKHIEESVYKTSGNFGQGFTNLQNETKVDNLLKGLSTVVAKKNAYEAAAELVNLNKYPVFKHEGSTLEKWVEDVQLRINIIENKERIDKLKEFKQKAEKLLSEEDQKLILFKDMANFLGTNV